MRISMKRRDWNQETQKQHRMRRLGAVEEHVQDMDERYGILENRIVVLENRLDGNDTELP